MTTSAPEPNDDEISEIAELLWNACREAEERGMKISSSREPNCCCPMGALYGASPGDPDYIRFHVVEDLPDLFRKGFWKGFDGYVINYRCKETNRGWELGQRFREQALSGEGFR